MARRLNCLENGDVQQVVFIPNPNGSYIMAKHRKSRRNAKSKKACKGIKYLRSSRRQHRNPSHSEKSQSFYGLEMLELRQLMSSSVFGDFNGDGFNDLVIGVAREDIGSVVDAGGINIIHGSSTGLESSGDMFFSQNSGLRGVAEAGDLFGAAIATGDFNGDGFDDVAIGVPGEDLGANVDAGAVNVIYGSSSGLNISNNQMWHQNTAGIAGGAEDNDRFGAALGAGDFNGDGFTDLAVGVPGESINDIQDAGMVNVIYGSLSGLTNVGDQAWHQDTAGIFGVSEQGDNFGAALAVGDFDANGRDDLAVGVPREDIKLVEDAGVVNVIYGTTSGLTAANDDMWHQNIGGIGGMVEVGDRFGSALATGDFDGNGRDDLAIGVPGEDIGAVDNAGAVNVIYGTNSGLNAANDDIWHQNSSGINGAIETGDQFGWVLATGDFDNNGRDDLAIGVPGEDIGDVRNAGAVSVIYGAVGGLSSSDDDLWHQNSYRINGASEDGDSFGAALAAGDFNNDGKDDLASGIPGEDIGSVVDAGAVSVIYGSARDLTHVGDELWHQNSPGINGVSEAGDNFGGALDAGGIFPLYSEFDVEVRFIDNSMTASQQALFSSAADRWSQIIIGDIADVVVPGFGWVDDVVIDASAPAIDGVGNILGQAGPSFVRTGSFLPARGTMSFDSADIVNMEASGQLFDVILHEMGHVLGIGTIWSNLGLITGAGGANPQFTGINALNAYNAMFGLAAASVPVENTGGPGTADAHWRETVFGNELMTGFIDATNPVSIVTVASLSDLGYAINMNASDA